MPINFVYADDKIYFHGAKSGYKIDEINKCNKVSLCVIDKDYVVEEELTTYFKSVILFGKARILNTDKEIFHTAKVFGLKYNNDVTAVEKEIKREWNALSCIEIEIEHMTGKEAIELTRKRG